MITPDLCVILTTPKGYDRHPCGIIVPSTTIAVQHEPARIIIPVHTTTPTEDHRHAE